jgi:hypothetical protein
MKTKSKSPGFVFETMIFYETENNLEDIEYLK